MREAIAHMEASKAASTTDTYRSAVEKWKTFVSIFSSPQWPIVWHAPTRWDMVMYLTWIAPFLKLASHPRVPLRDAGHGDAARVAQPAGVPFLGVDVAWDQKDQAGEGAKAMGADGTTPPAVDCGGDRAGGG